LTHATGQRMTMGGKKNHGKPGKSAFSLTKGGGGVEDTELNGKSQLGEGEGDDGHWDADRKKSLRNANVGGRTRFLKVKKGFLTGKKKSSGRKSKTP